MVSEREYTTETYNIGKLYAARIVEEAEKAGFANAEGFHQYGPNGEVITLLVQTLESEEKIVSTASTKRPLDWWQYFKERWFPQWLIRKYPLDWEYILTKHTTLNVCPHIKFPDREPHLQFLKTQPEDEV